MNNPLISICVPAYKAERYLAETLQSVAAQTYQHWTLVVTEDGSRDSTEDIVNQFAKTVSQSVRYERHDPNRGLPATRNAAIDRATTEWIALLDSDDLWTPDHLASCVETAERTSADFVHGGSILFDSDTGRELEIRRPDAAAVASFPRSLLQGRYVIQPASVMLRRTLWEQAGRFDPSFRYVEDWDMWIRCARADGKFVYTGRETCRYRKHSTALSTHSVPMAIASARALEKHLDWALLTKTERYRAVAESWAAAGLMTWRNAPDESRDHFARALAHEFRLSWWLRRLTAYFFTRRST